LIGGPLVFTLSLIPGEEAAAMIVDCAVYKEGGRQDGQPGLQEAWEKSQADGSFVWIGLFEPELAELNEVGRAFGLHELAIEDAVTAHQRPKLEHYGDSLFLVLKPAHYVDGDKRVEVGEILLFVGEHFLVSVRHGPASELSGVRQTVESRPDLMRLGPGSALHGILDKVVDDYRSVLTDLEQQIAEEVEAEVLLPNGSVSPERIYTLKRQVLELHMATQPLLDPLERLSQGRVGLVDPGMEKYMRDVHDHLVKVVHDQHRCRELLANAMDLYLSSTSARLNVRVGQLTLIASIFLPLTFLTGFFGMNFGFLVSRITSPLAFLLGMGLMLLAVAAELAIFKVSGFFG
jgi:magnesium transporter